MAVDLVSGGAATGFAGTPRTAGWKFTLSGNATATALGFWDEVGDGLAVSHQVGLWTDGGVLLATVVVDPTDTTIASAHTGGDWVFDTLAMPVVLGPGTYRVAAALGNPVMDLMRHQLLNAQPPLVENFAPGVTWLRTVFGPAGGGFAFPSIDGSTGTSDGYYGANLMLTIPEPTALLLLATGLAALAWRVRRSA
jgi:hypothetical protein